MSMTGPIKETTLVRNSPFLTENRSVHTETTPFPTGFAGSAGSGEGVGGWDFDVAPERDDSRAFEDSRSTARPRLDARRRAEDAGWRAEDAGWRAEEWSEPIVSGPKARPVTSPEPPIKGAVLGAAIPTAGGLLSGTIAAIRVASTGEGASRILWTLGVRTGIGAVIGAILGSLVYVQRRDGKKTPVT